MFNSSNGTLPVSIPLNVGNTGGGFGNGNGFDDIIALAIIAMIFGWNGNGGIFGGYGGGNGGASAGYVLQNDFATIQRQLSDGFNSVDNALDAQNSGICNLGYTQLQLNNQLATQIADCCCKTQSGNTGNAMNTATITSAIKDCCCENEMIAMQNKYDAAQANCATLQAIDKVGDRIIDYMANEKTQSLRDENFALKLASSQAQQNTFLQNLIKPPIQPCYLTQNPYCSCGNAGFYGYGYGTTIA